VLGGKLLLAIAYQSASVSLARANCWNELATPANVNVGLDVVSDRFLKLFYELMVLQ
jgi:hypothetical protein